MSNRPKIAAALFAALALLPAAAQGEILITQAKALAGNVTPGDAAGFPVTLSVSGSYGLAGNLQATANKAGIQVTNHDITIDLHGFRIAGGGVANIGIYGGAVSGVTIRNGTIKAFEQDGIAVAGTFLIVEDMRIVQNGRHGVSAGSEARIVNNTVSLNEGNGIFSGNNMHVEGNILSRNSGHGVSQKNSTGGGTILGNTIIQNAQWGAFVFGVGYGNNTILNNTVGPLNSGAGNGTLHPNRCSPQACF